MTILIILNEPAYGNERSYNGLRLGMSLAKQADVELRIFLMGDAVTVAKLGQRTPDGYYNLERMIRGCVVKQVVIGACGSCLDARGMAEDPLVEGVHRSSMDELTAWTMWADKVITF
jgi:uncharacterized protein involved in oxidation of intracellular sulfur